MDFPKFLRVVVSMKSEMVKLNGTLVKTQSFDRTYLELTDILSRTLGFSYELLSSKDEEIGRELENGSWTGLIGMVQRNETDMVVGVVSVTHQRLNVADFSYPFNRVPMTFATRMPEYSPELTAFLWPFSLGVWVLTMACLFLMPIVLRVLLHPRRRHRLSFGRLVMIVYCTIVRQNVDMDPEGFPEHLLLGCWKNAIMFLGYGYTAVLLSFLSFPPLSGVRTIPELAQAIATGKYQSTTLPGSFLVGMLSKSSDPEIKTIGLDLEKNSGSRDVDGFLSDRTSSKKPVFVGAEDFLLPLKRKYFLSEDEFIPALRSVVVQKGFCCKSQLDDVIGYVWASGLFGKINEDSLFKETLKVLSKSPVDSQSNEERPLSIEQCEGAFVVLIFGLCLSTVVFAMELVISRPRVLSKLRSYVSRKRRKNVAGKMKKFPEKEIYPVLNLRFITQNY